jgi:hypothetical protein
MVGSLPNKREAGLIVAYVGARLFIDLIWQEGAPRDFVATVFVTVGLCVLGIGYSVRYWREPAVVEWTVRRTVGYGLTVAGVVWVTEEIVTIGAPLGANHVNVLLGIGVLVAGLVAIMQGKRKPGGPTNCVR